MRNAVSLLKHYPSRASLSTIGVLTLVAGVMQGAGLTLRATAGGPSVRSSVADRQSPIDTRPSSATPALPLPGRPDPALAAVLLPRHAPAGAYRLTVVEQSLEETRKALMAALAPGVHPDDPAGAWVVKQTDPLEGFGEAGIYNRARMARLFAGKPVQIVRAPIERDGQVIASVTLLSPCPDADVSRLSNDTLVILFDVAAARRR